MLLVNVERRIEERFLEEALEGTVRKQGMERLALILVGRFLHVEEQEGAMAYKVYGRMLAQGQWQEGSQRQRIYEFLN